MVFSLALVAPASGAWAAGGGVLEKTATGAPPRTEISIAASSEYYLRLRLDWQKCVEIPGLSTKNYTQADVWTCVNQGNVKWHIVSAGDYAGIQTWYIKNSHSGKCLNLAGRSYANGAKIIQYTCSSALNNRWQLFPDGNYWELRSIDTNGYVNVAGGRAYNGAKLIQWNTDGLDNQDFTLDLL